MPIAHLVSLLLLVVSCCSGSSASAADSQPIEGPVELLAVLLDAQVSHAAKFSRCEFTATVVENHEPMDISGVRTLPFPADPRAQRSNRTVSEFYCLADQGAHYYRGTTAMFDPPSSPGAPGRPLEVISANGEEHWLYQGSNGKWTLQSRKNPGLADFFKKTEIAPDQLWFRSYFQYRPLTDILKPEKMPETRFKTVITREGEHRVRVEHLLQHPTFPGQVGKIWCVGDLSQGANLVEYGSTTAQSGTRKAELTWIEHAPGTWTLQKYRATHTAPEMSKPHIVSEVEYKGVNLNPIIPAGRFRVESFKDAPVSEVIDSRGGTVKIRRTTEPEISESELRRLAEEAKDSGFSSPKKDK